MNRIVIAVLLVGGCVSAQTDTPVTKPDEVCASLVTEISAISSNHVELAEFPAYAKNRESGSRIYFNRHLRPGIAKQPIQPSDFEKHGISLWFELDNEPTPTLKQAQSTLFPNLKLRLFSDLSLWEGASPELEKKLRDAMARHKAMLSELDKKAANKAISLDNLVYVDVSSSVAHQHPLVCGAGRDFPTGRELAFRTSQSQEFVHAVFPEGVMLPKTLDGKFVLHGHYQGIQNRTIYTLKRVPEDYRYFVVSSWKQKQ
jgi:hypothetical protein